MSVFKKLLVAYDGSSHSKKALEKACEIMDQDRSVQTHILYVVHPSASAMDGYGAVYEDILKELEQYGENLMSEAKGRLDAYKDNCCFQILKGNIPKEIMDYAKNQEVDLILLGSHGNNAFKEMILGSVSHHVVQYAACPVLVIK